MIRTILTMLLFFIIGCTLACNRIYPKKCILLADNWECTSNSIGLSLHTINLGG